MEENMQKHCYGPKHEMKSAQEDIYAYGSKIRR